MCASLRAEQEFLKDKIAKYFAAKNEEATIKYLDPSYMIRCVLFGVLLPCGFISVLHALMCDLCWA
jgi:hypothetical protein